MRITACRTMNAEESTISIICGQQTSVHGLSTETMTVRI